MNTAAQQIGRLAMRQEGDRWTAYYARPGTMEGALWLGAIHMTPVTQSDARKREFVDLMRAVVADIIEGTSGTRPTWGGEEVAPEHERAGNA